MPTLELIYFNAGGGHRAAAQALAAVIAQQGRPWQVRLVDLFAVLDPGQRFRRLTGIAPEDLYNKRLARGWTLGLAQELKLLQGMLRLGHAGLVRTLQSHWAAGAPDLVVSLVPNFNRALAESVAAARPGVPFVTVMTDIADLPPHFWIEPGQPQHVVCGSEHALWQARAAGCRADRVHRVSGMVLRPAFYGPPPADRAAERARLGLPAAQPVGLVMFGGQGSARMLAVARALHERPLILLCGHHEALAARLRAKAGGAPHVVVGFTDDVAHWMRLADYFVGKPGPGSLSEAVHCGLPVLVMHDAWTMPQERHNVDWVREHGLGLVVARPRDLPQAVARLEGALEGLRAAVARQHNRAVFEVVELLARLLDGAAAGREAAGRRVLEADEPLAVV